MADKSAAEGQSPGKSVLYFSRGRGRGHAIPDMAILESWKSLCPGIEVCFASYATGAATLAERGYPVIDLDLPEDPPFIDLLVRTAQVIRAQKPDLVISHEEFAALPAAKILGVPTIFLVDFLPSIDPWRDSLRYADQIVFMERRGLFGEPPQVRGKMRYAGPVVRSMCVASADRNRCRDELRLPEAACVVSVIPGAWATEKRSPIVDLVVPAFQGLSAGSKKLIWVAGRDHDDLSARLRSVDGALVLKESWPIEKLMVASDLVITKANRGTTIDLASLGIPSISLSFGQNPVDEAIIPRIRSNTALAALGIDPPFLTETMEAILTERQVPGRFSPDHEYRPGGADAVARELVRIITAP